MYAWTSPLERLTQMRQQSPGAERRKARDRANETHQTVNGQMWKVRDRANEPRIDH